jgi:hypothetical protein
MAVNLGFLDRNYIIIIILLLFYFVFMKHLLLNAGSVCILFVGYNLKDKQGRIFFKLFTYNEYLIHKILVCL